MTDEPIGVRVGAALREAGATLAVAESATGGLVCARLTDHPGASDYFDRGFITYAYEAKTGVLGVDRRLIDDHGAVSEPVAASMATGARDIAGTDWAVSVTGIAGPTGDRPGKPIGTHYLGVARAGEWGTGTSTVSVERHQFEGDRLEIREQAVTQVLTLLFEAITTHQ